jgi:hypothetical protein
MRPNAARLKVLEKSFPLCAHRNSTARSVSVGALGFGSHCHVSLQVGQVMRIIPLSQGTRSFCVQLEPMHGMIVTFINFLPAF